MQFAWPPQDPTRLTNPEPRYYASSSSAFVYGNDVLNPALRPTNAASLRSREHHRRPHHRHTSSQALHEQEEGPGTPAYYSSGSERDNDNDSRAGSSPEPYLSDYDDDGWGPLERGERLPRPRPHPMEMRVRQGSEGYEVRPMGDWNVVVDDDLEEVAGRPWEEAGRYNVYHPDEEWEEDSEPEDGYAEDLPPAPPGQQHQAQEQH